MSQPTIIKSSRELQEWRRSHQSKSIGFVPTMGALHEGHASLIKKSVADNEETVLSIFVNPTQFNQINDLDKYPRTWEADLRLASECGANVIFNPSFEEIYPDRYAFSVNEKEFSQMLCGAKRPGHFQGVLTVVMKLINLVQPQKVYMGEKDYQQLHLIKKMAAAFFLQTEIIGCPTIRNSRGLALSSRNSRLSEDQLHKSSLIYKTITTAKSTSEAKAILEQAGFKIDYLEDIEGRRFVAVFLDEVRLIDNVPL